MKKLLKILLTLTVAAAIVLVLLHLGPGLGFGKGNGEGDADNLRNDQTDESVPSKDEIPGENDGSTEGERIVVTVRENAVLVNGEAFTDAGTLKTCVEQLNGDGKVFELVEDEPIEAAYEMAVQVFRDLDIPLKTDAE